MPQNMQPYRDGIAGVESGGDYGAVGPPVDGNRAYGRYQVMDFNIPNWTQQALGRSLTPQEFLADPAAQDAVFDHIFGGYVDRYGAEGAARAWFTGSPTGEGSDGYINADEYVRRFNNHLGSGASAYAPTSQRTEAQDAADKLASGSLNRARTGGTKTADSKSRPVLDTLRAIVNPFDGERPIIDALKGLFDRDEASSPPMLDRKSKGPASDQSMMTNQARPNVIGDSRFSQSNKSPPMLPGPMTAGPMGRDQGDVPSYIKRLQNAAPAAPQTAAMAPPPIPRPDTLNAPPPIRAPGRAMAPPPLRKPAPYESGGQAYVDRMASTGAIPMLPPGSLPPALTELVTRGTLGPAGGSGNDTMRPKGTTGPDSTYQFYGEPRNIGGTLGQEQLGQAAQLEAMINGGGGRRPPPMMGGGGNDTMAVKPPYTPPPYLAADRPQAPFTGIVNPGAAYISAMGAFPGRRRVSGGSGNDVRPTGGSGNDIKPYGGSGNDAMPAKPRMVSYGGPDSMAMNPSQTIPMFGTGHPGGFTGMTPPTYGPAPPVGVMGGPPMLPPQTATKKGSSKKQPASSGNLEAYLRMMGFA